MSRWVEALEAGRDRHTLKQRVKGKSNRWGHHQYRWASGVPLTDGADALPVNWCEVTITDEKGVVLYRNAFITDGKITADNVAGLVAAGRSRWKIANNNVLKTRGYHLEHNFGHGKKHLASLLMTMNLPAFACHTLLELTDRGLPLDPPGRGGSAEILSAPGGADDPVGLRELGAADGLHDAGPGNRPLRRAQKLRRRSVENHTRWPREATHCP